WLQHQGIATATRRTSTRRISTPGAGHLVAGGVALRACSSVSNRRKPKPWRSIGSTQYPATKPGAAHTLGKISLVNAAAAAGACAVSIVRCISAACIVLSRFVSSRPRLSSINAAGRRRLVVRRAFGGVLQHSIWASCSLSSRRVVSRRVVLIAANEMRCTTKVARNRAEGNSLRYGEFER